MSSQPHDSAIPVFPRLRLPRGSRTSPPQAGSSIDKLSPTTPSTYPKRSNDRSQSRPTRAGCRPWKIRNCRKELDPHASASQTEKLNPSTPRAAPRELAAGPGKSAIVEKNWIRTHPHPKQKNSSLPLPGPSHASRLPAPENPQLSKRTGSACTRISNRKT